ncbi:hypothetical protein JS528_09670 [Bifidobacterium sp. MA2]|uniref:Uncharacterized protein n=1 Tax=Bifidobacterium santillanense TaxID=2809028 RepID=A0ABS5URK5_9BIFI|nr:hypothetical protein [Bifidobacterium santillanense]MBT1173602.1 hypothetical protein [Bifidobacterium santillanense]
MAKETPGKALENSLNQQDTSTGLGAGLILSEHRPIITVQSFGAECCDDRVRVRARPPRQPVPESVERKKETVA